MTSLRPISVLLPLRWQAICLVSVVAAILAVVGLGTLVAARACLAWLAAVLR